MVVECNHANRKNTQQEWVATRLGRPIFFAKEVLVKFYSLTPSFFETYKHCPEIEQKQGRPYHVLLVEWCGCTFAIPLRSHIRHSFAFIADGVESGLDFTKAVVIRDRKFVSAVPVQIRQHEFNVLKQHERVIRQRFESYLRLYIKKIKRRRDNPSIPLDRECRYSALQYFHEDLGL